MKTVGDRLDKVPDVRQLFSLSLAGLSDHFNLCFEELLSSFRIPVAHEHVAEASFRFRQV